MWIRTALGGLALTASLSASVHGEPSSDPRPKHETPQHVSVKLLPDTSTCATPYKVESESDGALLVAFDDLVSNAAQNKFRAYCRLNGTLDIPKGFALKPSLALTALVKGELRGGIDNVTGRLRITLGRYAGRDFELTEYADNGPDASVQPVKIELKSELPDIPSSCTDELSWPVSLFVETTINGSASSRIESLRLDSLTLVPLTCNP
jgi:hypothetical protein